MNNYENHQKRISFLALHRDLMGNLKLNPEIDGKRHEELCKYVFTVVEALFEKYPMNNGSPSVIKTDTELPF